MLKIQRLTDFPRRPIFCWSLIFSVLSLSRCCLSLASSSRRVWDQFSTRSSSLSRSTFCSVTCSNFSFKWVKTLKSFNKSKNLFLKDRKKPSSHNWGQNSRSVKFQNSILANLGNFFFRTTNWQPILANGFLQLIEKGTEQKVYEPLFSISSRGQLRNRTKSKIIGFSRFAR